MINDRPQDIDQVVPMVPDREMARWLVERAVTDPIQAQEIWDYVVGPLLDRQAYQRLWPHGNCRYCFIPHPTSRNGQIRAAQERTWTHRMRCPRYVGPLEHAESREETTFFGDLRIECRCGKTYPKYLDEDWTRKGACPDLLFVWRGPRPELEDVMSEQDEVKSNAQVQQEQGVESPSQTAVEAERMRLERLADQGQIGPDSRERDGESDTEDEDHEPGEDETADRADAEDEKGKEGETFHR